MPSSQPQNAVVLRLVPPPLSDVSGSQTAPAPEILNEMETKLREWLHGNHLDGCDTLRVPCLEVLNQVNDFLAPYVTEASEGVREFLRMVREATPGEDAAAQDELSLGTQDILRLVDTAQKVIPLPRRS